MIRIEDPFEASRDVGSMLSSDCSAKLHISFLDESRKIFLYSLFAEYPTYYKHTRAGRDNYGAISHEGEVTTPTRRSSLQSSATGGYDGFDRPSTPSSLESLSTSELTDAQTAKAKTTYERSEDQQEP